MPLSTQFHLRRLVLLVLLFAFAGCGRVAFISDRFDNFTAYYNTFYNAERSYTEGVNALEQTDNAVDRRLYMSIFEAPGQSTNDQKFQAAIDKSADVLRDHPESKWVDDALLLIGKSYFYQQNYVGAEQKFREVIVLTSPLEDEARFWLARTLIAAGAHDEAREHLLVSLNREDLAPRWEPSLRLALGELHVKRGDFESAIEELAEGVESVRDNSHRARGDFLLGQVYEAVGRYEEAVEAYRSVLGAHPRYELTYAALYSAVRVQGLFVNADAALQELRRMERDDKHYSNRYELAYLRGRIYQSQDYGPDAEALYHEILYDSEGQINDLRGRVHYALGELYRDAYLDFELASAHFDTARTTLRTPSSAGSGPLATEADYAPEAITDAEVLSETFGSFASVRSELAEMDSLLYLGSLDDEQFTDRILEIRQQMAEAMAEEERRAERMQAERGFQNAAASSMDRGLSGADAAQSAGSAGFLFHLDPVRVQEGRMNFLTRWGERPLAPDWRRIDAIQGVAAVSDSARRQTGRQLTDLDASVGENPLPPLDYSDVPRDSLSRAALRARRAAARYELANVLFLSMNRPDSAAAWYRTVIEEDTEFPVAQRAFYALAEVHSSLGDSSAARRLYEQVLEDYPESDFAGRVRERLGIRHDVPSDTLALAEEDYESAYRRWQRGAYRLALNEMVELAAIYPGLEVAPRALLAAGRIYMEWAQRDTLSLFDPIPLALSDSTLQDAGLLDVAADSAAVDSAWAATAISSGSGQVAAGARGAQPDTARVSTEELDSAGTDVAAAAASAAEARSAAGGSTGERDERPIVDRVPIGARQSSDSTAVGESGPAGIASVDADSSLAATDLDSASADSLAAFEGSEEVLAGADSAATVSDTTDVLNATPRDALALDAGDSTRAGSEGMSPTPEADTTLAGRTTATAAAVDADADASPEPLLAAAATEDHPIYLKTLFAGVKKKYPQTAYAGQAQMLLTALEEREEEVRAEADSLAAALAAAADTLGLGTPAFADSASMVGMPADSILALADSLAQPAGPPDAIADLSVADADTLAAQDLAPQSGADSINAIDDVPRAAENASPALDAGAKPTSDSLATADEPARRSAADSLAGNPDKSTAAMDSLAGSVDPSPLGADSLAEAADRKTSAGAANDSTSAQPPLDELDAEPLVAPAQPERSPSDSTAATEPVEIPSGEAAILGDGGIREDLGGFALIIGMDSKEATMRALAEKYGRQGFRTDVIVEEGPDGPVYRAAIGHFATRREAGILLQKYQAQITETMELAPLSDFE